MAQARWMRQHEVGEGELEMVGGDGTSEMGEGRQDGRGDGMSEMAWTRQREVGKGKLETAGEMAGEMAQARWCG